MSTAARALQASPSTQRHHFVWIVVTAGTVALTFLMVATILTLRYGNLYKGWGWDCIPEGDAWYVSEVDPQGVAAGTLQVGDRILSVEDYTPRAPAFPLYLIYLPANASYSISVLRRSEVYEFQLNLP